MKKETQKLIADYKAGSERALARLLSLVEVGGKTEKEILAEVSSLPSQARVLGITGAPGSGKSTLVNALAVRLLTQGKRVAVLAVDPSSPISGGAVLGDRIRMSEASGLSGAFIRSIASRGALGGVSNAISSSIKLLNGFGFDYILVESVGVGQGEVEIVRNVDTVLLVLVPGMGDEVQAMKAGIMEIADIYVLNKADYPFVDRLEKELLEEVVVNKQGWIPPVVRTVASTGDGTEELLAKIELHHQREY